jgi:4a-hydroxytetrahydrobiopterin dehydratase
MIAQLSIEERTEALNQLANWHYDDAGRGIRRLFLFKDFSEAFAFMTRTAFLAEQQDHHPEWSNVWNRVDILLTTHDANGLSKRDVDMAVAIDGLLK